MPAGPAEARRDEPAPPDLRVLLAPSGSSHFRADDCWRQCRRGKFLASLGQAANLLRAPWLAREIHTKWSSQQALICLARGI